MTHQHNHTHQNSGDTSDIRIAFLLNVSFTLFEIIGGLLTNSVAVLSDAVHDLGDSISLGLAWFLGSYSEKESNQKYTYGYRRYSLLGALINSVVLIGGSLFVLNEAFQRLLQPEPFHKQGLIFVAIIGVLINGAAVFRLRRKESMNTQVLTWHLLEDVLGWVAVLIAGIISLFIDAPIIDPVLSILITVYILFNAIRNLRKTVVLFLQASPVGVDIQAIESQLQSIDGVQSTHHTHMWSLDGEHNVLSTHLVLVDGMTIPKAEGIKEQVQHIIEGLKLEHTTIELEFSEGDCSMANHSHEHDTASSHEH